MVLDEMHDLRFREDSFQQRDSPCSATVGKQKPDSKNRLGEAFLQVMAQDEYVGSGETLRDPEALVFVTRFAVRDDGDRESLGLRFHLIGHIEILPRREKSGENRLQGVVRTGETQAGSKHWLDDPNQGFIFGRVNLTLIMLDQIRPCRGRFSDVIS